MKNTRRMTGITAVVIMGLIIVSGCTNEGQIQSGRPSWYDNPPETEDTARGVGAAEVLTEALSHALGEMAMSIETRFSSVTSDSAMVPAMVQGSGSPSAGLVREFENYFESSTKSTSSQYFGNVKVQTIVKDYKERIGPEGEADSIRHYDLAIRIVYAENDEDRLTIKSSLSEGGWGEDAQISHFFEITDDGFTTHDLIRYLRELGIKITIARDQEKYYVLTQLAFTDLQEDWTQRVEEARQQELMENIKARENLYERFRTTELFDEIEREQEQRNLYERFRAAGDTFQPLEDEAVQDSTE